MPNIVLAPICCPVLFSTGALKVDLFVEDEIIVDFRGIQQTGSATV